MGLLPPVEKLPLAVRKNVRDKWDNAKEDHEKGISELLGETWTIDVDINQLYAYCNDGYAKEQPGSMVAEYISTTQRQLKNFLKQYGDEGKQELNNVCTAHAIGIDIDPENSYDTSGVAVSPDGKFMIVINESRIACNINETARPEKVTKALNSAPTAAGTMSYVARTSIVNSWDHKIGPTGEKINEVLGKEIVLEPRFQEVYNALKAAGSDAADRWESSIGDFMRFYYEAFAAQLVRQGFEKDEMMKEALLDAMEKGVIACRVVDKSVMKSNAPECAFDGGYLYLQSSAERFGTNAGEMGKDLVDLL